MSQELTGKYVSSTYLNLVQHVSDNYYDGGGNLLNISDTSSLENTLSSYVSDSSLSNDFIWNNGYLEASLGSIMGLDAYATNVSVGTAFLTNASLGNLSQLTYSLNSSLGFKADLTYVDSSFALKTVDASLDYQMYSPRVSNTSIYYDINNNIERIIKINDLGTIDISCSYNTNIDVSIIYINKYNKHIKTISILRDDSENIISINVF